MFNRSDSPDQQQPHSQPRPRRVLVIDDEPHIREAIFEILELAGVDTVQAASGASGIRRFTECRASIGLIILDLSMPGMSGEETLAGLRAVDAHIPIIITSGRPADDLNPELAAVTDGFLQKPFSVSGLVNLMERHL